MQSASIRTLAVITSYLMLIVLVCPSIPTPTYLHQQKTIDHHAALPGPVMGPATAVAVVRRMALVVVEILSYRPVELVELTCQRNC